MVLLSSRVLLHYLVQKDGQNHIHSSSQNCVQFTLFPFRSPLLRESQLISFPAATKMFQFTALPSVSRCTAETVRVNSHSEILGSKAACASPKLIPACQVFHRLLEPSHPLIGYVAIQLKGTSLICSTLEQSSNTSNAHQAKP